MVSRRLVVVVVGLAVSGCAGFQPKPLVPRDVLLDLQRVHLEALRGALVPENGAASSRLNLLDGLSSDEAVAVGLFLNPGLRAFRRERGVAEHA